MLTRDSDLTRLLDHLEKRGLVERVRDERDRRSIAVHVTDAGLQILKKLDGPVERVHRDQLKHMRAEDLARLRALADGARGVRG